MSERWTVLVPGEFSVLSKQRRKAKWVNVLTTAPCQLSLLSRTLFWRYSA
jgi:hypothetical protein